MPENYLLPDFKPFRSSGGICYPSSDYHSMKGPNNMALIEKQVDNAYMASHNGKAYGTMDGAGKKKTRSRSKSKSKKKTTTTKKSGKRTKSKSRK